MHCMIVLFPGHTHYLGHVRVILGAWIGMLCMISTFPGHTHLLFGTYWGYIGCLGWYVLYDCGVSCHTHYLGPFRVIFGAWVGMQCLILTFPGQITYYLGPVKVISGAWVGLH